MSGLAAAQIQHQKTDPTPLVQAALNAKADATAVNDALALKSDAMQLASGFLHVVFNNVNGQFFDDTGSAHRALHADQASGAVNFAYPAGAGNLEFLVNLPTPSTGDIHEIRIT